MATPLKVAVVGSRAFPNLEQVTSFVFRLWLKHPDCIVISGGARGVDRTAAQEARMCGLQVVEFPPDWDQFGKGAGYRRNEHIVASSAIVVAFWDGVSRGTAHTIECARKAGKQVFVYGPKPLGPEDKYLPAPAAPEAPRTVSPEVAARERQAHGLQALHNAQVNPRRAPKPWWDHELGEVADTRIPRW